MTPDELTAIAERIAQAIGGAGFTDVTVQPLSPPKPAEILCTSSPEGFDLAISIEPI